MRLKSIMEGIKSKPLIYTVVLLLLAVGAAYVADRVAKGIGGQQMVNANDEYLAESIQQSGSAFISLSAIKAGVAVIEGSSVGLEAGVTADLQAGDAVQSVLDFVDLAWRITFFSSVILFLVKTLLIQISSLGPPVMLIVFVTGALLLSIRNWNRDAVVLNGIARRVFWFFLMCAVGIYIALPLSVGAARWLSNTITRPVIEEGAAAFEEIQQETSSASMSERLFPEGEKTRDRLNLKKKVEETALWCKDLFLRLCEKGIRFCAGFLFDCIIFPGALLLAVWAVIKKGLAGQKLSGSSKRQEGTGVAE